MKNIQSIEKRVIDPILLSVHSVFLTIQGEGPFCGVPAVFVRLAGCNLQCPLCDTDYTTGRQMMLFSEIVTEVRKRLRTGLVVITGGEPFRQDISALLNALVEAGYYVQIETNGTLPPVLQREIPWNLNPKDRKGVYIICAPKTGKLNDTIRTLACAYKYVIQAGEVDDDGLPKLVLKHSANPRVVRPPHNGATVYVQPADEQDKVRNELNLKAAISSCMNYGYTLQLQIHKIINME